MSTKSERDAWAMRVLGAWLRDWRLATGASQRWVAVLAGIDQAHLCRIEHGTRRPSGAPLGRIIIALDWLSGGGTRGSPWSELHPSLPSPAARWGVARPPAVVGREPLPPAVVGDEPLPPAVVGDEPLPPAVVGDEPGAPAGSDGPRVAYLMTR